MLTAITADPNFLEATKTIACALAGDKLDPHAFEIQPEDIPHRIAADVWSAVMHLAREGKDHDALAVHALLREWGIEKQIPVSQLLELSDFASTPGTSATWAKRWLDVVRVRRTETAVASALERVRSSGSREEIMAGVMHAINSIPDEGRAKDLRHIREPLADAVRDIDLRAAGEVTGTGASTGLRDLDASVGGLRQSEMVIIAGRPSMGKSALAGNMLCSMAKRDPQKNYLLVSLEMSAVAIVLRLLARESRVDFSRIMGRPGGGDLTRIVDGAAKLGQLPVWILDRAALTVSDIRQQALRVGKIGGIFVDYLQLARPSSRNERRDLDVAEISSGLRELSKAFRCPVIALSQLNRSVEQTQDKRPNLSHLRESGSLEQDADLVLLLYREAYYFPEKADKGAAEICVAKNKQGPTGVVRVGWDGEHQNFFDLARGHREQS